MLALVGVLVIPVAGQAADPAEVAKRNKEIAELLLKKGASIGKMVMKTVEYKQQLDAMPPDSPEADLKAVGLQYQTQVDEASFAVEQLTIARDLVGVGIAGGLSVTGVGVVPGFVAKAAWNAATDYGLNALNKDMTDKSSAFLAINIDKWTAEVGLDPKAEWSKMSPEELREKLEKVDGPLANLKKDMSDNPEGYRIASEAAIKTLQKTNYAVLDKLQSQGNAIKDAQQNLAKQGKDIADFEKFATAQLKDQSDKIAGLTKEMDETRDALGRLQSSLDANTAQTRAVADVLFANMSPREKLAALDGSLVSHLSDGTKKDLKKVLTAEVKKQETLETFNKVVSNLASVHAIASNLGIKSPELAKAVQVATVAQSAISQAMSGNYLGAVAAVSGLFGGQTDPAAERHQQLMAYLESAFREVNAKLDEILDNQKKMMTAIVGLSEQMAEYNRALHQRLDRMEFEQKRILDISQQILWQNFIPCSTAYQFSLRTWVDPKDASPKSTRFADELGFQSLEDVLHVRDNASDAMRDCIKQVSGIWTRTKKNDLYGQILSLQSVRKSSEQILGDIPLEVRDKIEKDKQYYVGSDIQTYLNDVYSPLLAVALKDAAADKPTGPGGIAHLLVSSLAPSRSLTSYRQKQQSIAGLSKRLCGSESLLNGRWYELLCTPEYLYPPKPVVPSTPAQEAAASQRTFVLFSEPLSVDVLEDVLKWTTFAAAYRDWLLADDGPLLTPEMMLTSPQRARGRDLIYGGLGVTDIAIAQYAIIYGDATSRILFRALWDENTNSFLPIDPKAPKEEFNHLRRNPFLARNVLMWALDEATSKAKLGSTANYRFALEMMEADGAANSPDAMRILLGDVDIAQASKRWAFEMNKSEKRAYFVLGDLKIPMPTVEEYRDRRLIYPNRLTRLENWRSRLAEKYADYTVFEKFTSEKMQGLVRYMKD